VYLFQPRQATEGSNASDREGFSAAPLHQDVLPSLNTSALQPGSAAEWAIGELLIRLCSRGRPLRPEPPDR
jgi:hypothetical protein